MIPRIATFDDIPGILQLQQANLYDSLNQHERKRGFVTTPFSEDQLRKSISRTGLFVVENDREIIAYAFADTWEYFEQWPIFPYMTSRFDKLSFKNYSITTSETFQYGPVCVNTAFRGKGVFNLVFEEMRKEWVKKYALSITFINKINDVSTRAHSKLGWNVIDEFEFNKNKYLGLAFEMSRSVLNC